MAHRDVSTIRRRSVHAHAEDALPGLLGESRGLYDLLGAALSGFHAIVIGRLATARLRRRPIKLGRARDVLAVGES